MPTNGVNAAFGTASVWGYWIYGASTPRALYSWGSSASFTTEYDFELETSVQYLRTLFYDQAGGGYSFNIQDSAGVSPNNQWINLTCVYSNGSVASLYTNGILAAQSGTITATARASLDRHRIGMAPAPFVNPTNFLGTIGSVIRWSKPLTSNEVFTYVQKSNPTNDLVNYAAYNSIVSGGRWYLHTATMIGSDTNNYCYRYAKNVIVPYVQKYPAWQTTMMTGDSAPIPNAVMADSTNSAWLGWYPYAAGNADSPIWQSANSAFPHWTTYDCGAGNSNVMSSIVWNPYTAYPVGAWQIQGSQNNSSWTTIYTNAGNTTDGVFQVYSFPNSNYYRYYRFYHISGNNGNYVSLRYLYMNSGMNLSPVMTNSNAPSPYVVTADSYSSTFAPWMAFMKKRDTVTYKWLCTNALPNWIEIDMGSNVVANGYSLDFNAGLGMKHISFQGSTNNSSWDTLYVTNSAPQNVYFSYMGTNATSYRYYRWYTTNIWSTGNLQIYNIQLWQGQ